MASSAGALSGGATGAVATGWNVGPNIGGLTTVASQYVDGSGFNHQVVTVSGTSSGVGNVFFYRDASYTIPVGGVLEDWAEVSVTGISGVFGGLSPPESIAGGSFTQNLGLGTRTYPNTASVSGFSGTVRYQIDALLNGAGAVTFTMDICRPTRRLAAAGQ